ncbi:MAG: protein kinase domain-containing protein [Gemmatimonadales bacterium]
MAFPHRSRRIGLESRIQAAVGDTYHVLRELGGGGMSRVFLAEETRLSRQVVIKVLPPEMGAGVNAERFEREIRLAARLQHPHIVPLLTAGSSGDLLYYVMPFIAGESLRAKLTREGELPVAEALRILREVTDALAYAHRNGVVHRDIKPENVLMSEGHAVVSDFGVAKAVSASSGSSLTSLGVALGTPAYMAPEQAAADPHVDHRADLYALGVLAYEMLCGRTPFVAASPQAMLAAHITQAPEPVLLYRQSVAPALSSAIMRCLEKRAADRWQNAAELAAQLEVVVTPSGGHAPTGAAAGVSSSTEAAIRRGHPGRVAGLFAAGSALVLATVYGLVYRLGLPDWVLYGAGVLLLLGLPITLMAGIQERRRAQARTIGLTAATPVGLAPWASWRRALIGGGLAFAGLGILAAGYTAMRLFGIGPVGTLVASGVLEQREQLILADFENRSTDSALGQALTEAFRVDLSQSPTLRLVDPQAVADGLRRMERPAAVTLTPSLAREVAERQGVKAVVAGKIDPVGRGYVLSASLLGAADGRVLAAVRESADDQDALLPAIDRLSKKLRERIGESLTTIRANAALEQVTTGSLEALQKYTAALRLEEADRVEEAIPLLEGAVALDSGFAMAWRKLAVILGNTERSITQQTTAATQAFRHRDRLPALERDLATGYYHSFVDGDHAKVVAAYRAVLTTDPDNVVALNNLSIVLIEHRRFAEAESLVSRATHLGRGSPFFLNTVTAQVGQGHLVEAQETADRYSATAPGSPYADGIQSLMARVRRDLAGSERLLRQAREHRGESRFVRSFTARGLSSLAEQQGKLGEARRLLRELLTQLESENAGREYLEVAAALARLDARYGGDSVAAAGLLGTALGRYPLQSVEPLDRPYLDLIPALALAGKAEEAKRLYREFETVIPEGIRRLQFGRHPARGAVAAAEGRHEDALEAFAAWLAEDGSCGTCGSYELGTIHDRLGHADSAIAAFERVAGTPTIEAARTVESYALAPSLKRLGELYESRGDRRRAADYYGRFVDLWKNADAELQPAVREVRARLAQLAREPGG